MVVAYSMKPWVYGRRWRGLIRYHYHNDVLSSETSGNKWTSADASPQTSEKLNNKKNHFKIKLCKIKGTEGNVWLLTQR